MSGKEKGYSFSKQVTVSGDAAVIGSSNTDFAVTLSESLQKIWRVSIESVSFPNNAYNVNATGGGTNNTFAISVGAMVHTFEVNGGFYTTSSLSSAVQTAIQAFFTSEGDGQTITLAQDTVSQKVSVTYTEGTSGESTILIERDDNKFGIWDLLGFDIISPITITTAVATIADNLPALGGLKMAYLTSNNLAPGNSFDVKGLQKNILVAIPITVPFGVSNVWECKVDELCAITYKTARDLQTVDFALRDKYGNLIDLHGGNMFINLRVWFQRF